jgi:hydrogenase maturation protease
MDWESFLNPPGAVPPEEASLEVGEARLAKGSRVRLYPKRSADSMDLFLAGRTARVQGIYRDVEDAAYVAVSLEDDPASDLHDWHGRFYYFYPEEVEPLAERSSYAAGGSGRAGARHGDGPDPVVSGSGPLPENQADVETPRILIAGVGNIFLGDDGFGVEVARRLAAMELPGHVRVADFGIRGVHLAYELLERGYDTTILVDATPRGREPGTVYLIEPDLDQLGGEGPGLADAHGMDPRTVFALLKTLGGTPGRVLIVGCEPARTEEEMGLSAAVTAGVDEAIRLILDLLAWEDPVAAGTGIQRKEAVS